MTEEEANTLSPTACDSLPKSSAKVLIGVYPRNVSEDLAANLSLPLQDIQLSEFPETVVTPPVDRGAEFQLDWDAINAGVSGPPTEYPLMVPEQGSESSDDDDNQENPPRIPILCHRVKVQRYDVMEIGEGTDSWDKYVNYVSEVLI